MKAKQIEPGYWQVVDGEKWYTAKRLDNGQWFVRNHHMRSINQGSAIHRRVTSAISDSIRALSDV